MYFFGNEEHFTGLGDNSSVVDFDAIIDDLAAAADYVCTIVNKLSDDFAVLDHFIVYHFDGERFFLFGYFPNMTFLTGFELGVACTDRGDDDVDFFTLDQSGLGFAATNFYHFGLDFRTKSHFTTMLGSDLNFG
ncbi:MAG: hypothetical protein BWY75_01079 [bacterium ADurb.Bin425]|nr:MAG: hypothetical protein BWY75_01079 [bacterium ADurb.Bin425]